MKYRPLGRTGLSVSEIGFGCWGLGGVTPGATSYGEVDDAASLKALHRALDLGITFYDTSNLYGDGHSEELLGEAFTGRRDKVVIATKAGRSTYDTEAYTPAELRRSVEASLRRLRSDYVDVVQVHSPSSIEVLAQNRRHSGDREARR
jgi:aryl-alcohol dehydrogenase-like predicted oxidoreductase